MLSELLIGLFASVLLVYWFRCNCRSILKAKSGRDYARQVATANRLSFPEIQSILRTGTAPDHFDPLGRLLLRDYRILSYLLRHTAALRFTPDGVNERMLMLDFRLMQIWYTLTRRLRPRQARRALEEMSCVLGGLAHHMGERALTHRSGLSRA